MVTIVMKNLSERDGMKNKLILKYFKMSTNICCLEVSIEI